tara:strand:- start:48 stop:548 length:501 start_codon:yes stop_codon:yes gene_type:complete
MTVVALTVFIEITDKDGNVPAPFKDFDGEDISLNKFQNGNHEGIGDYKYLSFIYQGAAINRTGDNLEASIILANNPLSMAYVKEFVDKKYYVEVETFVMDNDFNSTASNIPLTKEYWLAASLRYDSQNIELLLSSAIDAVGANVPQKTLSTDQCKHLPLTGTIQNR